MEWNVAGKIKAVGLNEYIMAMEEARADVAVLVDTGLVAADESWLEWNLRDHTGYEMRFVPAHKSQRAASPNIGGLVVLIRREWEDFISPIHSEPSRMGMMAYVDIRGKDETIKLIMAYWPNPVARGREDSREAALWSKIAG